MFKVFNAVWLFPRLSETFILNPLLFLEAHGCEMWIFAHKDPRQPTSLAKEDLAPEGQLHQHLSESRLLSRVAYFADAQQLHIQFQHQASLPDVFWFHWSDFLPYLLSWPPLPARVVLSCHEPDFSKHALVLFSLHREAIVDRVALLLVETSYQREALLTLGYPEERVACWQAGVDMQMIDLVLARWQTAPTASHPPRLISTGRFVEKKGFLQAIEAMALLQRWGYQVSYEIVGDGILRPSIEQRIRLLGLDQTISLSGKIGHPALFHRLAQADLFLAPSAATRSGDREGIMSVVLEAMACGLPVVSTQAEGTREVIRHGETGWLIENNQPETIAAALAFLLRHPQVMAQLGTAASAFVRQSYDLRQRSSWLLHTLQTLPSPRI